MGAARKTDSGQTVDAVYDDQYSVRPPRDWRELGAQGKAANIRNLCGSEPFPRVLEVGAGEGAVLAALSDWTQADEFYAVEISNHALSMLEDRNINRLVESRCFDGYQIPYSDAAFDLTILSHVLEHVEYPRKLLRELARVSRYQLIEIPLDYRFDVDQRYEQLTSYGHINVYTPTLLRFLLKTEGFEILRDKLTPLAPAVKRWLTLHRRGCEHQFRHARPSIRDRWSQWRFDHSSRRRQERKAYTYTVLCQRTRSIRIFDPPQ